MQAEKTKIRFMKKGVKDSNGNYTPVWYSHFEKYGKELREVIIIYAKDYKHFSDEIVKAYQVINDTDISTDYFENSRIVFEKTDPMFSILMAFCKKQRNEIKDESTNQINRVKQIVKEWHEAGRSEHEKKYPGLNYDTHNYKSIKERTKYYYLNEGTSGVFMIEKTTEYIYRIKAYGQIHPFKACGHIDRLTGKDLHRLRWW